MAPTIASAQLVSPEVRISTYGKATYQNIQCEPSLAALGDHVLAAWQNDLSTGGGIGWGFSLDGGQSWTDGHELPNTWGTGYPDFQPTVCADHAGNFYLAVLASGGGYMVSFWRGSFQGTGFVWQFGNVVLPSAYEAGPPFERPWLTCDPDRGYLYLTYTKLHPLNTGLVFVPYVMTIYITRSLDQGASWSAPVALSSTTCNGAQPAVGPDGELYVVWEDFAAQQVLGRKSTDFGASFGPSFSVAPILDNLATAPTGWGSPRERFNPIYPPLNLGAGPDFPSIAIDRSPGPRRGTVYTAWADYASGTVSPYTGTVYDPEPNNTLATAAPFTLGNDIAGFILSADFGGNDCDYYTFEGTAGTTIWLSGEAYGAFPGNPDSALPFQLYCGADLSAPVQFARIQDPQAGTLPPLIYTLPSSGRYYIKFICSGGNNVSYRLRTRVLDVTPGQAARDFRDIVLVSSSDGGATWSAKRRVNDDPPQFDNALPSLAVDDLGQLHIAWYDRRDDTVCGKFVHTYWTESLDGAVTFLPARRLSGQPGSWQQIAGLSDATNIGDHLGLAATGDRAYVLWTDARGMPGDLADIYGVSIRPDPATAVAVSGFRAEPGNAGVSLLWSVADPAGLVGFRIARSEGSESYQVLESTMLALHGAGEYREADRSALPGTRYRYKLEAMAASGGSTWFGPVEVELPAAITRLALEQALPNPFNQSVQLTLAAPQGGEASVRIYDLLGHEVATLSRGPVSAGRQVLAWDGRDRAGHSVPPGVYLVRAELGHEASVRRVIRIQ